MAPKIESLLALNTGASASSPALSTAFREALRNLGEEPTRLSLPGGQVAEESAELRALCLEILDGWGPLERAIALLALSTLDPEEALGRATEIDRREDPSERPVLRELAIALRAQLGSGAAEKPSAPPILRRALALLNAELSEHIGLHSAERLACISEIRHFTPRARIWSAGEKSDSFLLLVGGSATSELATRRGSAPRHLTELRIGQLVGIHEVVLRKQRAESLRAGEQGAEVLVIKAADFKRLLSTDRLAGAGFLQLVSTRLAGTLEKVAAA
jgi:hypothetical protein